MLQVVFMSLKHFHNTLLGPWRENIIKALFYKSVHSHWIDFVIGMLVLSPTK